MNQCETKLFDTSKTTASDRMGVEETESGLNIDITTTPEPTALSELDTTTTLTTVPVASDQLTSTVEEEIKTEDMAGMTEQTSTDVIPAVLTVAAAIPPISASTAPPSKNPLMTFATLSKILKQNGRGVASRRRPLLAGPISEARLRRIVEPETSSSSADVTSGNTHGIHASRLASNLHNKQSDALQADVPSEPADSGSASKDTEVPSTGSGRAKKFRSIAQGLRLMSHARVNATARGELTREQNAFLSKYGMSASEAENAEESRQRAAWRDGSKIVYIRDLLVVDSSKDYFYYWMGVVSTAYIYNLLFIIFRCVFVSTENVGVAWIIIFPFCDVLTDLIYVVDTFFRSRTGYLEQGLLVRDVTKITKAFKRSHHPLIDALSLLPLDYVLELAIGTSKPLLRFNRLIRVDRIKVFIKGTETRISIPNAFRIGCVVAYILVLIHWNACAYFFVSSLIGLGSDSWVYGWRNKQSLPKGIEHDTLFHRYVYSFYWSTLQLTTLGEVPGPVLTIEFIFVSVDLMIGVLIFATIVGNVGSMISNMSAARSEFQNSVDGIKQFMKIRQVGRHLINRVLKWFDYLWLNKQTISDEQVLGILPRKLQAEISMHVHFETLRKVRIFQDCEAGLLAELVLKLQLQVFSPMDYVCRKGDIGREMYIVKRGRLQVVADDGLKVLHTLQEGAVFGELSVLNIAGNKQGNRRSASIRSVGYTDLFVLKKADLWEALREYPGAQKVLIQKGRELLRKDGLLDETVPEETKTPDEVALELRGVLESLQLRLAKLVAEHVSTEHKLSTRCAYLEAYLHKYGANLSTDEEENEEEKTKQSCSETMAVAASRKSTIATTPSTSTSNEPFDVDLSSEDEEPRKKK